MELTDFREKYGTKGGPPGTPWGGSQGVYVVSPSCPTQFWEGERCGNNVPRNVKIGKASGEDGFMKANGKGRLRHYRTYWPNGVTVHALLITPSFDRTVHTVKDEALKRETTLRRIFKNIGLVGFGWNGRGGDNGTSHLGSEWIHLTPSKIMNYLIAAGPIRHTNDKLYGCTKNKCERVDIGKMSRNVTRLNDVVKSLEYVLEDERNEKKLGVRGRPVVLPRTIINAAKNKAHPLHIYSHLLVSNVNKEMQLAQRRLANRKKREVNAAEAKIAGERLTRVKRQVKRKRLNAMKRREPRNLAAIRPTLDFNVAMKLRAAVTQPRVRKPIERFIAEPAHQAAARQAGVGLARGTTKKRGRGAGAVAAERAKKPPRVNQDALNTIKRHPNHRQRYNFEKKAVARRLFEDMNQPSSDVPESPPSPVARTNSCPLRGTVLYEYPNYTYFDVTGDGRCYFYAVIKALGDPLHRGMGRKSNTNRFVNAENYFNPARQIYWKQRLKNATFHDPIDVLYDSVKMGLALRNRGILYVAKLVRTRRDFSQVHAYMLDPIAQIRQSDSDGVYKIDNDGSISLVPEVTSRLRKNQDAQKSAAFNIAFREGRVVTFVWRNIPRLARHYEAIIPKRIQ